ncbi:15419_t:CDS:2 [Gigaspora rosea]|nr:15419_t:CDS:2 [Gigaspora rosea]
MEELENSEKKETIIFFEEEPHIISEIYVSKDGKYIITYDQFNDSLLGWIIDENDVRTDNEIGIFKIERQQDDRDKNLLFKISSIKTKISMIVFDDRGYEFLEFTSIDELIIFVEEEQIMYFYLVNFKENKWRKKMSLKIRTFMERISFVGNFDFVEEMDRIVRVISPDSNSTCIYLITNNEIVKTDKTNTVQKKEKKRIINVKSIRTGLVVRTFAIQSLESGEEDNEKWYIIRSFDCLYIIAFINTKILLLNIANGRKYVITNDLNEEIKVIINENLSNFNIFTINAPDNTLFGIQDNKILKKNFRNLDFGKFFYNQNFEAHIWDSYLNIQEPYVNLYSFSPDIQELKRVKQLPVDAIKRRSCENELLKWSWKSPEYKIEVGECTDLMMEIINNTDLIINTGEELCIFHFDLNLKSVTLQYYWRIFSKNENSFIPFNLENALFLPRTDLFNSCKSLSTNQQLLGLWIGTIKGDKFSFAAYGEDLMICFIHFRATFIVLDILEKWIKWFIESPRENFHFLKLIIILYPELYKSFPEQMKKFHDTLKFSLDKEYYFVPASEISKVVDENIKDSEQNAKKFISENKALLDLVQLNLK